MKKIFSNIVFLSLISICVVFLGIMISCMTGVWHWFARSGAILIIIGLILPFRNLVRKGCSQYLEDKNNIDCGTILGDSPKEIENNKQDRLDLIAICLGIIITILGTLIWGYGDLIK